MDKKILTSALMLLIIEFVILFADMGLLHIPMLSPFATSTSQPIIGVLEQKRSNVKRKSKNSLVWEESETQDSLKAFDSILTLNESSALIKLKGNIQVDLHENTLVVLEPISTESLDHPFRLKFFDGRLAANTPTHRLLVGTDGWTIEAKKGTEFSLKKNKDQKIEIDIKTGSALLSNKHQPQHNQVLMPNTRVHLGSDTVLQTEKINKSVNLLLKDITKFYSHSFPLQIPIGWTGKAHKLIHWNSVDGTKKIDLEKFDSNELKLSLNAGTHTLYLETEDGVTSEKTVHIWTAPKLRYFSPLPRNRVPLNKPTDFSWTPLEDATKYKVEIHSSNMKNIFSGHPSDTSFIKIPFKEEGTFFWSVSGEDHEGNKIPPFYFYQIHSVEDPLDAPQLKTPELRKPANEKEKFDKKQKSSLHNIWELLFPKVSAEETSLLIRSIVFSWHPVEEADFYIIEISESPDFTSPTVNSKVSGAEFKWSKYKKRDYYWRVAAGTKTGKMGLFSDPTYVDLSTLNAMSEGNIAQGVLVEIQTTPKPEKISPPLVTPSPPDTPPVLSAEKINPVADIQTPPPIKAIHSGRFLFYSGYSFQKMKNIDSVKSELTGFQPFGFGYYHLTNWGEHNLSAELKASKRKWQPKNKDKQPFQKDLSPLDYAFAISYGAVASNWQFGLIVEPLIQLKRVGQEEVTANDSTLTGLRVTHKTSSDNQDIFAQHINLSLGQDISQYSYTTEWLTKTPWESTWNIGIGFKLKYFSNGEKFEGHSIDSELSISKPW